MGVVVDGLAVVDGLQVGDELGGEAGGVGGGLPLPGDGGMVVRGGVGVEDLDFVVSADGDMERGGVAGGFAVGLAAGEEGEGEEDYDLFHVACNFLRQR